MEEGDDEDEEEEEDKGLAGEVMEKREIILYTTKDNWKYICKKVCQEVIGSYLCRPLLKKSISSLDISHSKSALFFKSFFLK